MGSIANIIARGIQQIPPIKSAREHEMESLAISQAREQQRQTVAKAELERRKLEQAERDQQAVARAMQEWDPKTGGLSVVSRMVQLGASPGAATKTAESLANLQRDYQAASAAERANLKLQYEQAGGILEAITQEQDIALRQQLREKALATGLFQPEDLSDDALPSTINAMKPLGWVTKKAEADQRTATLKAQQQAAEAQRANTGANRERLVQVAGPDGKPIWVRESQAVNQPAAAPPKAEPAPRPPLVSRHTNARGEVTEILTDAMTGAEVSRRNLGAIGKPDRPSGAGGSGRSAREEMDLRLLLDKIRAANDWDKVAGLTATVKEGLFRLMTPEEIRKTGSTALGNTAIATIADTEDAIGLLNDIKAEIKGHESRFGPLAGQAARIPWANTSKIIQGKIDLARQRVGKAYEGGVLRKEDEEKYKKILGEITNTPEAALGKTEFVLADLERKRKTFLESQRKAGRAVNRIAGEEAPPPPEAPPADTRKRRIYNPATRKVE